MIGAIDWHRKDLGSRHLGVIGDFKTQLEKVPEAKSYQFLSNKGKIGALGIEKCS